MPDVAFCREIHRGYRGADVISHKRALSRWNPRVYPWAPKGAFTDVAGPYFFTALYEFKRQHRLLSTAEKTAKSALVLGTKTHEAMEHAVCHFANAGQPAFDRRAITLAQTFCTDYRKTPEEKARDAVAGEAWWLYLNHRFQISYSQHRPFEIVAPPGYPSRLDCSGFVTLDHLIGGFPNPNGNVPTGEGYTGTLKNHGTKMSGVTQLSLADLIFYGYAAAGPGFNAGDPTHVALYVGKVNGVSSVLSMGHYPMSLYRYDYRSINASAGMRHYPFGKAMAEALLASLPSERDLADSA